MDPQNREERSEILDPDLVTSRFTSGWAFAVPASFKAAFDIRWDVRQEKLVTRKAWTQGKNYCFSQGDVLYDTQKAYEVWSEALKHLNTCIEVIDSIAAGPQSVGQVRFRASHPDESRIRIVCGKTYTCSQPGFVELLRTGYFEGKFHRDL
jgi:hypothetical protein